MPAYRTPEAWGAVLQSRGGSQIVRAPRLEAKGSLNAIDMLEEDMRHFESVFPKAGKGELQEQYLTPS
jgi:hypothetical protein